MLEHSQLEETFMKIFKLELKERGDVIRRYVFRCNILATKA